MRIIVTARTRNEEERIERYVMSYQWTDKILVADGGSEDNTVSLCESLPKTEVRHFDEKIWSEGGRIWRNPHGKHINFLIDWAKEEGADWIIFDDCDCVPNYTLKTDARYIFKNAVADIILANRIYIYGEDKWFEKLTKPSEDWIGSTSLWAWRADADVEARELNDWEHSMEFDREKTFSVLPPACLLHYFYPTEEFMEKKLRFYRNYRPSIRNPKEYGGELLDLKDWMRE